MDISIEQITDRIDELLRYKNWTLYRLAKEADMSASSLNNIYKRNTFPTIPTLTKICNGFNISLSEFFDFEENPLRLPDFDEDEERILYQYRSISNRKKEIFNAYLEGLSEKSSSKDT